MAYDGTPTGNPVALEGDEGEVQLTCIAAVSGARSFVTVPADAPAREVAATLGGAVGIEVVGDLLLSDGTPLPPDQSLRAAGVTGGATVIVAGIDDAGSSSRGGLLRTQLAPPSRPATPARPGTSRTALAAVGGVVVAAVGFSAGALAFHGSTSPAPAGPDPVGVAAARAWVGAVPFAGAVGAGVPANLDRSGTLGSAARPVGWWASGDRRTTVLVVAGTAGPFSLTAVTVGGVLAYPPTIGGLPPTGGIQVPPVPSRLGAPDQVSAAAVEAWATRLFGAHGSLTGQLHLGMSGGPQLLGTAGVSAGRVVRVAIQLRSDAAGTTEAARSDLAAGAHSRAKAALAAAQKRAASAQAAVGAATARLAADRFLAAATPATPASAAAAAALPSVTASLQAVQKEAAGSAASLQAAARAAAAPPIRTLPPITAVATYDVLIAGSAVVGWVPAGSED